MACDGDPGLVAGRLFLLRSLRDDWGLNLSRRCVAFLPSASVLRTLSAPITFSSFALGVWSRRLNAPPGFWPVPFAGGLAIWILHGGQLRFKLGRNLALKTEEGSSEVVEYVLRAETIPRCVVGGVHWIHDYKRLLVRARQRIE